jgi:transcriptional regulator with XRE-family HTH domain
MNGYYWIEEAKKATGITSDRQIAIRLGITTSAMSHLKSGNSKTLDEEHCLTIAEMIGIDPAIPLTDQAAERAKSPAVRRQFERLGKLAASGSGLIAVATICLDQIAKISAPTTTYLVSAALQCTLC